MLYVLLVLTDNKTQEILLYLPIIILKSYSKNIQYHSKQKFTKSYLKFPHYDSRPVYKKFKKCKLDVSEIS